VSEGATLPAYLVKGDDASLRAEAVRALVTQLVGDGDRSMVVEEFDVPSDDPDTAAAVDAASTPPFLSDRRVVVVRDVSAYPAAGLQPVLRYLQAPSPTSSLVLVAGERAVAPALTKAVKEVGHVIDASAPRNAKARAPWLKQHLADAPVRFDGAALDLVDKHLGEDLGRLESLLATLAAAYGSGSRVTADDVRPFLGEAGSVPPWELTDAIDQGRTDVALAVLRRMLSAGDRHPLVVIATLHSHFGRMLRLDGAGATDERSAAAALGIKGSTFPARKALSQGRKLGGDGVRRAIALLAQADLDLKGASGLDDGIVLDVLVARLSRLAPRPRR
jgi:DNA polymerase-3 subunit delta